ncbi:MAG: long-chain fatty acid--CoA ligase [Candidatus Lokiarchaeota archaeon]|nr:long-chain fatty acid--CoA ligase [Candidatus Lokiarchaeota archaeon]
MGDYNYFSEDCPIDIDKSRGIFDKESSWVRPGRLWQKYYPKYIPKTLDYETLEKYNGLYCILKASAEKFFPNNISLNFFQQNLKYSYREVDYYSMKIASALEGIGVKKGDPVALMAKSCPEFVFAMWACIKLGAILVPINPLLKKKEVNHILSDCGNVKTAIIHEDNFGLFKRSAKDLGLDDVVLIQQKGLDKSLEGANLHVFDELMKKNEPMTKKIVINMKDDIFCLLYTGGTTGLPKGVMLTHFNVLANINQLGSSADDYQVLIDEELGKYTFLNVLPLCHSFGIISTLTYSTGGGMLIVLDKFDAGLILKLIEMYKVGNFSGVPTMYIMLAQHEDFHKRDLTSLSNVITAGAALAPAVAKKWQEIAKIEVRQGYGLTECSPGTHLQPYKWFKWIPESIGIPIIDTDVKVVDPITLEELEPGQPGEFLIRGPQVMKGYWKKPEATASVLIKDKEGKTWLRTGDIGYMDENGVFYISGRTKEMIKYKGYRILPAEVEAGLYEHPAVLECGVIGIPDETVGERIKAFIKLKPSYKDKITAEEIQEWAKENMAAYKWPREIEFISSIPKTSVGKVMRRALRDKELKNS